MPARSGARQNVTNPATGAVADTVPTGDAEDADIAIRAADRALEQW
ncbi:aldehyde dehydrogenase family protein, partial [Rhizobiaceae sp. 2RAB30]